MDKKEIKKILTKVVIAEKCGVDWESMKGDDRTRFCNQCNLNVHNLSVLNEREAAEVLNRNKFERTCIFLYERPDGSVKVDNCPRILRTTRNRLIAVASFTLVCLSLGLWHGASAAGGLVGAGVPCDMGQAADVAVTNPSPSITQIATTAFFPTGLAFILFKLRSKKPSLWFAASLVCMIMFGAGVAWALGIHV